MTDLEKIDFDTIVDLPEKFIEELANSNISNHAFLPFWVTTDNSDGRGHLDDIAGVKVLQKRGYNKVKNVLKEMFLTLNDLHWVGEPIMHDFLLTFPRNDFINGLREAVEECFKEDTSFSAIPYYDLFNSQHITQCEFNNDILWQKLNKLKKRILHCKYDFIFDSENV